MAWGYRERLDPETGLYYFNARWYDEEIGRIISEDPAQKGDNWCIYAENNPLYLVDIDGYEGIPFIWKLYNAYQTLRRAQFRGTVDAITSTVTGFNNTVQMISVVTNPVGTAAQFAVKTAIDPKKDDQLN